MVLLVFFSFSFSPFPENNSKVLVNEDYSEDSLDTKWLRSFSRLTKRNLRDLNFVITGIQDQQDSTWKVAASTGPNETIIVDGEKRGATEVVVLLATQWTAREPRWAAASIEIVKQRQKVWLETTRVQDFSLLLERYWFSSLLISFARYHSFVSKKATRERERALLTFRNISLVSIRHPLSNTRSRLLPLISKGIRYLFSARQRRNLWVARFISLWKGISPLNDFIVLHSFSSPFLELPLLKYSLQFLQNEFFFGYFLPKYLVSMMLYFANENIQIL